MFQYFCGIPKVHVRKRDLAASNTLINVEVEANKSEDNLNYPVDIKRRNRLGSHQVIKFQGPEETKRRVKKEVKQVDRNK